MTPKSQGSLGDLIVFGRENRPVHHGVPRVLPERPVPPIGTGNGERIKRDPACLGLPSEPGELAYPRNERLRTDIGAELLVAAATRRPGTGFPGAPGAVSPVALRSAELRVPVPAPLRRLDDTYPGAIP